MQQQKTSKPLARLLKGLLGSTLFGMSAVAVSQPDEYVAEPLRAEQVLPEPLLPVVDEPVIPVVPQFAAEFRPEERVRRAEPPLMAPIATPESIVVTAELTEADYVRLFEDMDANRNGVIEAHEARPGIPADIVARLSLERQMTRTDGRQEGGYEAPVTLAYGL